MTTSEGRAAFTAGEVDAWAIWPPFVEEQELYGNGIAFGAGAVQILSVLAARTPFIMEQQAICQAIVNVLDKAKHWIIDNIAETQEIVSSEISVSTEVVQKAFPKHNWKTHLEDAVVADMQGKADFLKSHGSISMPVNVRASMLDTSFTAIGTKTLPYGVQSFLPLK
jgi:sulfonate transport system substrate-binding protein